LYRFRGRGVFQAVNGEESVTLAFLNLIMNTQLKETCGKWLLLALTALVYLRALTGEFVWDDTTYFVENDIIAQLKPWDLGSILLQPVSYWGGVSPGQGLLFVLEYFAFGSFTPAYHLVSLALYLAVGLLAWRFTSNIYNDLSIQASSSKEILTKQVSVFLVVALFLLHPIHVEAVAYISAQPYLLYTVFSLLAINIFWSAQNHGQLTKKCYFIPGVACYYLAVLSNSQGIATGLFIPALWVVLRRKGEGRPLKLLTIWALLNVPLILWINYATKTSGFVGQTGISFFEASLRGVRILGAHFVLAIKPFPLNFGYPFDHSWSLDVNFVAGLVVLFSLGGALLVARRSIVTIGLLIFTVFLFPAMQIFIGVNNATIFDRYLFIPILGLCLIVERGFAGLIKRKPALTGAVMSCALALAFGLAAMTFTYIPKFGSNVASLENGYQNFPGWKRVAFDYETALIKSGNFEPAAQLIDTDETFAEPTWVRNYFRGWIELEKGNVKRAIHYLEHSSREIHRGGYFPFTGVLLGRAYIQTGQLELAEIHLRDVLASPLNNPVEEFRANKYLSEIKALNTD
jgi:hypothetical protein